ncbi:hypothetical protein EXS66_02045 [Candidatus Saccharibacteria bacterium]|nr:hypothetical protein [Candidatus Saccharibacteria bacterium]
MKKLKNWWTNSKTWQHILLGAGLILFVYFFIVFTVRIVHYDRILPGVSLRGIYVGGLTKPEAVAKLNDATSRYLESSVTYQMNGQTITAKPSDFGVSYDNQALVDMGFELGHDSNILADIASQTMLPFAAEDVMQLGIENNVFSNELIKINNAVATPSQNAEYQFNEGKIAVIDEKIGQNINTGFAMFNLARQFSALDSTITLPIVAQNPSRTTAMLDRQKDNVTNIAKVPLTLAYGDKTWVVSQQQLISWLFINTIDGPFRADLLNKYYTIPYQLHDFTIERQNVAEYLNGLAGEINQEAIDAKLIISGGRATVFQQSRDGTTLNVQKTIDAIIDATTSISNKPIELVVDIKKADVSDENIDNLGIKELLSEGVTYFPGSSQNRIQNVRVGANRFNGILLKPGQVFSFGEYLGDVGPEQGYALGLIILDKTVEKAYGGGLCQVSSTAYRAALLAGLPIVQRTNHSYAVSYYTEPFGVPGVDATIYYPDVDFKFKNDTGWHILIETEMIGTTLKFRFYGTKTKAGVIRGPSFIYGSNDVTKPSHTVFWRDVVDLNGKVTKTDEINTYYKSSLDFPVINN